MTDTSYSAEERALAMRSCLLRAQEVVENLIPQDEYDDEAGVHQPQPTSVEVATADLKAIQAALGAMWQNLQANPPVLPAGAWRGARIVYETVPSFDASERAVLLLEIPGVPGRIFRKTMTVSGAKHPLETAAQARTLEILRDAMFWLAGECKPITKEASA